MLQEVPRVRQEGRKAHQHPHLPHGCACMHVVCSSCPSFANAGPSTSTCRLKISAQLAASLHPKGCWQEAAAPAMQGCSAHPARLPGPVPRRREFCCLQKPVRGGGCLPPTSPAHSHATRSTSSAPAVASLTTASTASTPSTPQALHRCGGVQPRQQLKWASAHRCACSSTQCGHPVWRVSMLRPTDCRRQNAHA